MKNKLEFFRPLMDENEYKFIEKFLNNNDVMLEWGSGNSTLYFSGIVKKILTIEHKKHWVNILEKIIKVYNINNISIYHIPDQKGKCRFEQFKDYVNFPVKMNLNFNKVLIDGRARKYCAKSIYNIIDNDTIVFIHDFNREDYKKVLKYYDIIDQETKNRGIVALRKKLTYIEDNGHY